MDPRRHRAEQVGLARSNQTHRRGRAILPVVGMEHQEHVQGACHRRVGGVWLRRDREHQVEEVGQVVEVVLRIDVWLMDRVLVGPGDHGRSLGDQASGADVDSFLVVWVEGVGVIGGQSRRGGGQDLHWVGVVGEGLEEMFHVLPKQGVEGDRLLVCLEARPWWAARRTGGDRRPRGRLPARPAPRSGIRGSEGRPPRHRRRTPTTRSRRCWRIPDRWW